MIFLILIKYDAAIIKLFTYSSKRDISPFFLKMQTKQGLHKKLYNPGL
jgi:hypothetical protein